MEDLKQYDFLLEEMHFALALLIASTRTSGVSGYRLGYEALQILDSEGEISAGTLYPRINLLQRHNLISSLRASNNLRVAYEHCVTDEGIEVLQAIAEEYRRRSNLILEAIKPYVGEAE